ncbi:carboxypeptidase regulatory-like domain-containing protein [Pseudoxanthomonas mexicana]
MTLPALLPWLLAGLLALGVLLAWARLIARRRGASTDVRGSRSRFLLLCALQPVCALLLYFTLLPPRHASTPGTLVVMTANAGQAALPAALQGQPRVALPEATATDGSERVPDLGTALRRHPDVGTLHVVGDGLEARDRDALGDRRIVFSPTALPRGVVELAPVGVVAPGDTFIASGRVNDVPKATVVLFDPAGQRIDAGSVDAQGRFRLTGVARLPGPALFRVEVREAGGSVADAASLPVWTQPSTPPRMWVLAGAPHAEGKYLRRWATDAGIPLHLQVSLGGGMQLGDAPLPMNAETLRRFDLLVLDARSAAGLGEAQRAALGAAVRDGLGVLVRADGPISPPMQRLLGVPAVGNDESEFRLPRPAPDDDAWRARRGAGTADLPVDADAVPGGLPVLTRRSVRMPAGDDVALLRDAAGTPAAWWHAMGRGRVGVWTPADTYTLVLAGHADVHATLWSQAFATLARAGAQAMATTPDGAPVGERVALCGIADDARIVAPDGITTQVVRDPASGSARCAGFWPRSAGWHQLKVGDAATPFFVRAEDDAPSLHRAELQAQTRSRTGAASAVVASPSAVEGVRGPAWPWFLAWLSASALLWWLERRRAPAG